MQNKSVDNYGRLYIVPTPIGNLSDITQRALTTLQHVDLIVTEDKRITGSLLKNFFIKAHFFIMHNYNEKKQIDILIQKLKRGMNIALVSDAGTPLISDPGYHLVHACHKVKIRIEPLPGPCAAIVALSASGLPTDRFCYEGFLPNKPKIRCNILRKLKNEERTLIFYESTHRLLESLEDMIKIFGKHRYIVLARELTKTWESIYGASLGELLVWVKEDENRRKGEMVLIVKGYENTNHILPAEVLYTFMLLKKELSLRKAVELTAKIYGAKKNKVYKYAVASQKGDLDSSS